MLRSYLTMKICMTIKKASQYITIPNGESDENQNISNSEDVTSSIDNRQNTDKSTSIQNDDCYNNNQKHSEVIDFVEYEILRSNDFQKTQNVKIAGKVSDKYSDWHAVPHPDFFWAYHFLAVKDWVD